MIHVKHFPTWSSSLSRSSLLFLWRNTALDSSLNFCNKTSSSEGSWRVEEKKILQCWSLFYTCKLLNAHLWTLLAAFGDQIKICGFYEKRSTMFIVQQAICKWIQVPMWLAKNVETISCNTRFKHVLHNMLMIMSSCGFEVNHNSFVIVMMVG